MCSYEIYLFFVVCKIKVDFGFLLDGFGSVNYYGVGNFDKCKEFVKVFIYVFVIFFDDMWVGVILFFFRSEF